MSIDAEAGRFRIRCRRCERELLARRAWVGQDVRCPHCSSVIRTPTPQPGDSAALADPPALTPARFFNFPCPRCDVLLGGHTGMSGGAARCPTCGVRIEVPFVDPGSGLPLPATAGEPPPEELAALHAYAADGRLAPQIVQDRIRGPRILCGGCGGENDIEARSCAACGTPFSIDAVPTGFGSVRGPAGMGALVLGIAGLASVYLPQFIIMSAAALLIGARTAFDRRGALSWTALVGGGLGLVGVSAGVVGWAMLR